MRGSKFVDAVVRRTTGSSSGRMQEMVAVRRRELDTYTTTQTMIVWSSWPLRMCHHLPPTSELRRSIIYVTIGYIPLSFVKSAWVLFHVLCSFNSSSASVDCLPSRFDYTALYVLRDRMGKRTADSLILGSSVREWIYSTGDL